MRLNRWDRIKWDEIYVVWWDLMRWNVIDNDKITWDVKRFFAISRLFRCDWLVKTDVMWSDSMGWNLWGVMRFNEMKVDKNDEMKMWCEWRDVIRCNEMGWYVMKCNETRLISWDRKEIRWIWCDCWWDEMKINKIRRDKNEIIKMLCDKMLWDERRCDGIDERRFDEMRSNKIDWLRLTILIRLLD